MRTPVGAGANTNTRGLETERAGCRCLSLVSMIPRKMALSSGLRQNNTAIHLDDCLRLCLSLFIFARFDAPDLEQLITVFL